MQEKKVIVINPTIISHDAKNNEEIPKKRVCAYARVSTDQEDQINSYNAQIKEYTERIKANPNWKFVGMYADEGISGTSMKKRLSFLEMIDDAKAGNIDLILTKSLSRFSRNTVDSLTIIRELREINVEVFFEKENLSSLDTKIDFMLTIFSSIAQEEARNISENVKWGIRKRFQEGKVKINTKRFLGYDKDDDGNLIINESEANTIRMIFNLYVAGKSYKEIYEILISEKLTNGRGLVKWNSSAIKNILENEKYMGDVILQKTVVLDYLSHKSVTNNNIVPKYHIIDNHPGIVSKELFKLARIKKEEMATSTSSRFIDKFPLSGIVLCSECGRPMNRHYYGYGKPSQRIVLSCKNNYHNAMVCSKKPIDNKTLEQACGHAINSLNLLSDDIIDNLMMIIKSGFTETKLIESIEKLNEQIREIESEIVKLIETKISDNDPTKSKYYNDIYTTKRNQIEVIEDEIKILEAELLSGHQNKLKYDEIESYLNNKINITSVVLTAFFKYIIVINSNRVIMVMSDDDLTKEQIFENLDHIKLLKPIYEATFIGDDTKRVIEYSIIKYSGDTYDK